MADFAKIALPALLTGGSAIAGGLNSRGGTSVTDQTRTRVLSPVQQLIEGMLGGTLQKRLADPTAGLEPVRTAGRNKINAAYSGAPDALREKFLTGGGTASGRLDRAGRGMEMARVGALSGYESDFAKMILQREDDTLGLSERMLTNPAGERVQGTTTGPSNMLGGSVSGGLETATLLYSLNKLLKAQTPRTGTYNTSYDTGGYGG